MRADAQEHRRRLIAAASHVFATQGPDAPLRAVIDEAGCGRGTLYRHFCDREALIMAVVESEIEERGEDIARRTGDPELLVDILTRQSRAASIHLPLLCTIAEERIQAFVDRLGPTYDAMMQQVLDTARACGQVQESFTLDMLHLTIEMLGAARTAKGRSAEQSFALALRIVLDGLRPRPGGG